MDGHWHCVEEEEEAVEQILFPLCLVPFHLPSGLWEVSCWMAFALDHCGISHPSILSHLSQDPWHLHAPVEEQFRRPWPLHDIEGSRRSMHHARLNVPFDIVGISMYLSSGPAFEGLSSAAMNHCDAHRFFCKHSKMHYEAHLSSVGCDELLTELV